MIVCVAIVGRANNPIFIRNFVSPGGDDDLFFHYLVHCALDAIEEKMQTPKPSVPGALPDSYLGLLYPTEDHKVYGYMTNTRTKFVLILTDSEASDSHIHAFFRRFHSVYSRETNNPFYVPGTAITSRKFERGIANLVQNSSAGSASVSSS